MTDYFLQKQYTEISYGRDDLNLKEFEGCTFMRCNFSACSFIGVTFIDCTFTDCNFNGAKINHVAFRTVHFNGCLMQELNFAMCDKLIFEIHFNHCNLGFAKFYTLKIKGMAFIDCSMIAVDFMKADLTEVIFDRCDLYKTVFINTILNKADFRTSFNYTLDPEKNKVKRAMFSLENVKGLLEKHHIIVMD